MQISTEELHKRYNMKFEEKLKDTKFFVEATSFETFSLWLQNKDRCQWDNDNFGSVIPIGTVGKNKQVWVSFMFVFINNHRVCFYETTSRYNDTEMVENWIKTNYPVKWDSDSRIAMTNADNFHHVLNHCI